AGKRRVYRVVEVVAPLAVEREAPPRLRPDDARIVEIALCDHQRAAAERFAERVNRRGDLGEDVHGRKIEDAVDGVQTKAIEVALAHPIERVVDEVAPDLVTLRPIEVDRLTPRRAIPVGEVRPEFGQVISFRPEVVVDDVKDDAEPDAVSPIDEAAER